MLYRANAFLRRSLGTLGTLHPSVEVVTRTPGRVSKHVHWAMGTLLYGADENAPKKVFRSFSSPWKTPSLRSVFSTSVFLAQLRAQFFLAQNTLKCIPARLSVWDNQRMLI